MTKYDCIVIGGGPAGLAASLTLGRARRKIAIVDNGTNRNRVTQESHGFLTRDGIKPQQFKDLAMKELQAYPSISILKETVTEIKKDEQSDLYTVHTPSNVYVTENIVLATGIQEEFFHPEIRTYYGKSLFSCPYCDGWEIKDSALAVLAENEEHAHHMAKLVFNWSEDLIVFTNGHPLSSNIQKDFESKKIKYYTASIKSFHGENGKLESIELDTGEHIVRSGGFVVPTFYRPNPFAEQLGCEFDENGSIVTDGVGRTTVKGIYTAGENEKAGPSSLMISAAEGNRAATSINMDITMERF